MNITIESLKKMGFKDVSHDKNGLAYRRSFPGGRLEICCYQMDQFLRLQTVGSGMTIPLKGVKTIEELNAFWYGITGEYL
jgi:hypothetical protein